MSMFNLLAFEINFENFIKSLPYVGYGMLGIFIVMGVIILIMTFMGKIEAYFEKKKAEKIKAEEEQE